MCRWNITCLSNNRPCGSDFGLQHGLICNKDGFVTLGSNRVRDITATLLERVCPYVKGEQEKNQFSKQRARSAKQKLKYSQDVLEKLVSWHVLSEECFTQSKNVGIRKSFAISEKKVKSYEHWAWRFHTITNVNKRQDWVEKAKYLLATMFSSVILDSAIYECI